MHAGIADEMHQFTQRMERLETLLFHADADAFHAIDKLISEASEAAEVNDSRVEACRIEAVGPSEAVTEAVNVPASDIAEDSVNGDDAFFGYCDVCRSVLCVAAGWWHQADSSNDLCAECYKAAPASSRRLMTMLTSADERDGVADTDISSYSRLRVCCDECKRSLRPGCGWYHAKGSAADLCHECWRTTPTTGSASFDAVMFVRDLGDDLQLYVDDDG